MGRDRHQLPSLAGPVLKAHSFLSAQFPSEQIQGANFEVDDQILGGMSCQVTIRQIRNAADYQQYTCRFTLSKFIGMKFKHPFDTSKPVTVQVRIMEDSISDLVWALNWLVNIK